MGNPLTQRVPEFIDLGPACLHDVKCWTCGERSAMYLMNDTAFVPCDQCRTRIRSRIWATNGSTWIVDIDAERRPWWKRIF